MTGVQQLGYLGFEVSDLEGWARFATDVLGLVVSGRGDAEFTLRNDRHQARFLVREGPADDLAFAGWQVADSEALTALAERLRDAGHDVDEGTAEEAGDRGVAALIKLTDPGGVPTEIFHGPALADAPFTSEVVPGGFVADDLGLGHVVLTTRDRDESLRFYRDLLGFGLSDHIVCTYYGHDVDIAFMHANPRHHSLALGAPQPKRLHHFLLEAREMQEVGRAYDRALAAGLPIVNTLGQHPNDRMFSFYAMTPSGFQFEFGWGGLQIDPTRWEPATHHAVSDWGHHPPQALARRRPPKANP